MRQRPVLLLLSACLFLYFPVELIVRWTAHDHAMHPLDIVFSMLLPAVLLIGLIRVTKVGWYTLIAGVSLWGVRDLYEYYASQSASMAPLMVHLMIYCVSLAYFINPRIRHLYFDPKLRWWRTKPRYETHIPFLMNHNSTWHYPILRNISEGGCFVETPHLLDVNDPIQIAIPLPIPLQVSVIKTEGEIRWVSANPLRPGMGIQFKEPPELHAEAIREYVRRQL